MDQTTPRHEYPAYRPSPAPTEAHPAEEADAGERVTLGWLARYWQLLAFIAIAGLTWGGLRAEVAGKVDRTAYLQDKARADSIAGSILQEQRAANERLTATNAQLDKLLHYLCRANPGPGC